MTKLSDTQAIILVNASQRFDGNVLPLPGSLRGGAQAKVIGALLKRGLIEERAGQDHHEPDPALNTVWRNEGDGRAVRLYITEAGLAAIGCGPEDADAPDAAPDTATEGARDAPKSKAGQKGGSRKKGDKAAPKAKGKAKGDAKAAPTPRIGTKQAMLIDMLRAPEGASIEEIVAATGWQPHTVRGAIAGALKKKLGLDVSSDKIEGRGRIYKICS